MSADAKVWPVDDDGLEWGAVHDGPCRCGLGGHKPGVLREILAEVEDCLGSPGLRWVPFQYPDGFGLRGYRA